MPTYVYCRACDRTFEADQRIVEPPLDSCECGSTGTVKRIIQPIAVMFKGSGFHINDYAASTAAKPATKPEDEPIPAAAETPAPTVPAPSASPTEAAAPKSDAVTTP